MCAAQKKRINSGPGAAHGVGTSSTVAPEFGEALRGRLHQRRDLGIDAGVAEIGAVGDALAFDALVQPQRDRRRPGFQRGVVERVRPGHHLQHQRAVGDRAGHRAVMRGHIAGAHRIGRHAAEARLQSEHAAEMRRHADRAGAVAALVQRAEPGRGGRAPRRPTRRRRCSRASTDCA